MDPDHKKKKEAADLSDALMHKLGHAGLDLNEHEQIIATDIVLASEIDVKFSDIGGLADVVESLREAVIFPLTMPHLFKQGGDLVGPPKGVLLYGPPGCGKTMIAKALARESGATFVNLHVSSLTDKWFGSSQKLVRAVFSLAQKLQPTIVFVDEIDAFLRTRQSADHEVTGMMKSEFMSLWDGMGSSESDRILILGATNRLEDIDKAFLRRMPKRFAISLPDKEQRKKILEIILKDTKVEGDRQQLLYNIANFTRGCSGSDLKEICRDAIMLPMREIFSKLSNTAETDSTQSVDIDTIRPLKLLDFLTAVKGLIGTDNQDVFAEPVE